MPTPIRQLLSQTSYNADGVTTIWNFSFSGGYLNKSHVKAFYRDPAGVIHTIPVTLGMFTGPFQLNITPAVPLGVGGNNVLTIYRDTPKDLPIVDFTDTASFTEISLDTNAQQAIFCAAENADTISTSSVDANVQTAIDAANAALSSAFAAQAAATAAQLSADASAASAALAAATVASKSDIVTTVTKDSSTGAGNLPVGTTAQRPVAGAGKLRFNSDLGKFEGNSGAAWGSLGGAAGGGNDAVFYLNDQTVNTSYAIPAGQHAHSTGPITIANAAVVTVPNGSNWAID